MGWTNYGGGGTLAPGDVRIEDAASQQLATVTGAGAVLTDTVDLPAAAALADALGVPTTTVVEAIQAAYNGATFDLIRSGADNADAVASAALGRLLTICRNTGFNGATWDLLRALGDNADGVGGGPTGRLVSIARNTGWNGASWDLLRALGDNADGVAPTGTGKLVSLSRNTGFNGTNWDRLLSGSDNTDSVGQASQGILRTLAESLGYTGAVWSRLRIPSGVVKAVTATASGNTALWTPTSGKKFRLMRFLLLVTANASVTGGATVTVKFQDATTDITGLTFPVFFPTAAGTILGNTIITPGFVDLGNGVLSATANNVLNLNLSSAITTGSVACVVTGTEE